MAVDLTIDPDTVRLFAQKARAIASAVEDAFEDGHEHDIEFNADSLTEARSHDGLQEEESDDLTRDELKELIEDLNVDESAELVALAWIGRGDYDANDWKTVVDEARSRAVGSTARYVLGMSLLADYLEEGLDAIGM